MLRDLGYMASSALTTVITFQLALMRLGMTRSSQSNPEYGFIRLRQHGNIKWFVCLRVGFCYHHGLVVVFFLRTYELL